MFNIVNFHDNLVRSRCEIHLIPFPGNPYCRCFSRASEAVTFLTGFGKIIVLTLYVINASGTPLTSHVTSLISTPTRDSALNIEKQKGTKHKINDKFII